MTMKVLYEKGSQRLLGAQIVGQEGVDKRIDVLATAMQAGLPVTALKDLDLAYTPPYASAKDPVNLVGFMAENLEAGGGEAVPLGGRGWAAPGRQRNPAGRPDPWGVQRRLRGGLCECPAG